MPLGAIAVLSDTLFSELYVTPVFSFYFSQLIAKKKSDEHFISPFRRPVLELTSRASSE